MNGELLTVLEAIAREKGLDREVLIKAVESSLASVTKKTIDPLGKRKNIFVHIDRQKGNIKAFAELTVVENGTAVTQDEITLSDAKKIKPDVKTGDTVNIEVTPSDFGRIAAQSAKQIIIQKIREAERDIVFSEFKERVGDITMGTVRRKEKGNFIVDLGRTEGILPIKEQCPEERYNIGDRIRTYILDVKPTSKGPEIVLSRTNSGLVRRLFELEVPEIASGTVEIKKIVREPGYRCKVSVASVDPRVDPIGACVGMRGSRIKNIVREMENEKLDIIKWESDISDYAINALSPAKVESVTVNEKGKKLEVRVAEDQLSIAIGKKGQNVRLASKLIEREIDVRKVGEEEEISAETKEEKIKPSEAQTKEEDVSKIKVSSGKNELAEKLGISDVKAEALINAGFHNIEEIANAEISKIMELDGFGEKTAAKIKEKAQNLVSKNTNEQRATSND